VESLSAILGKFRPMSGGKGSRENFLEEKCLKPQGIVSIRGRQKSKENTKSRDSERNAKNLSIKKRGKSNYNYIFWPLLPTRKE